MPHLLLSTLRPRTVIVTSVLTLAVLWSLAISIGQPTRPPERAPASIPLTMHRFVPTGMIGDSAALQEQVKLAAKDFLPVVIAAGAPRIDVTVNVPGYIDIRSESGPRATILVATKAIPIFKITPGEGGWIEGLSFTSAVPAKKNPDGTWSGATGIVGEFTDARVNRCSFWGQLLRGIDSAAILTGIVDCRFGVDGNVSGQFAALRIGNGARTDASCNANWITGCRFYNSTGDSPAVDVSGGFQLDFIHNNVELNKTTVPPVRFAGLKVVRFESNWMEANTGPANVTCETDAELKTGVVLDSTCNWWMLSDTPLASVVQLKALGGIETGLEGGNQNGKPFASDSGNLFLPLFDKPHSAMVGQPPVNQ